MYSAWKCRHTQPGSWVAGDVRHGHVRWPWLLSGPRSRARSPPGAPWSLGDVELDPLVLGQAFVALSLDRGEVHEDLVVAAVLSDEAEPFSRH